MNELLVIVTFTGKWHYALKSNSEETHELQKEANFMIRIDMLITFIKVQFCTSIEVRS